MTASNNGVLIEAESRLSQARCSACGQASDRVHGRYRRTLLDLPVAGRAVTIRLRVRRFRCLEESCPRATFSEQIPNLTLRYARRTTPATSMLADVALVLAGRAGARLAVGLGLPIARDTLLRLIRRLPDPAGPQDGVEILGVDDFALRKGHHYGTVLVDLATHRPLELLPDREGATVSTWLKEHGQNVQIYCRDRAGAYAQAARDSAADAVQVADRWHLWHNLAGHVEKAVKRLRHQWQDATDPAPSPVAHILTSDDAAAPPDATVGSPLGTDGDRSMTGLDARHRERWHLVRDLLNEGLTLRDITRRTGLARGTVRIFARAERPEDLYRGHRAGRGRELDQHRDFLAQQWNSGNTNAAALLRMLRERGYCGQSSSLRAYLRPWRANAPTGADPTSTKPPVKPLTVRELTRQICTRPDDLTDDEAIRLSRIRHACPPIAALAGHVRGFAEMLTKRTGERDLNPWIAAITSDKDQPELRSFTRGLLADYDAVRAGLSLPYSSGPVEGNNTRIKMIKRKLYGRANLDLLRKLVLLAP